MRIYIYSIISSLLHSYFFKSIKTKVQKFTLIRYFVPDVFRKSFTGLNTYCNFKTRQPLFCYVKDVILRAGEGLQHVLLADHGFLLKVSDTDR